MSDPSFPTSRELTESAAQKRSTSSTMRTFFNITKCFIGAASFELPWAFKQGGWLGALFGVLALFIISNFTLRILVLNGHLSACVTNPFPSYPDIGTAAFGRVGNALAWFGVLAMTIGVCGSYILFISGALADLSGFATSECLLIVVPVVILLSWLRSYTFLAPTSVLGILALLFALVVTVVDGQQNGHIEPLSTYPLLDVTDYPLFLGNAAFLYLIHSVVIPVEQSMKDRSQFGFALNVSLLFVTALNVAFALTLYFMYGSGICGSVIDNLSKGKVANAVKILLSVDLLFTSALFLFPVSESVERVIFDAEKFGTTKIEAYRNVFRTFLVLLVALVGVLVPSFPLLTGLSGAFGNNLVGLILPPIFYLSLQYQRGYYGQDNATVDEKAQPLLRRPHLSEFSANEEDRAHPENSNRGLGDFFARVKNSSWSKQGEVIACLFTFLFGLVLMVMGSRSFVMAVLNISDGDSGC